MVRVGVWLLAAQLALTALVAPARADRIVRVRAETRIELDVSRGDALEVRGVLRDDGGTPLAGRRVTVTARPEHGSVLGSSEASSGADGDFAVLVPSPSGSEGTPIVVDARFDGDADLEGSSVRVVIDAQRAHVVLVLGLETGNRLSLDQPTHTLTVSARSAAGGAGLAVRVANEIGEPIAEGTTDANGELVLSLAAERLGPPASGRLIARSDADEARASAQTEIPIVRYRETTLVWQDTTRDLGDRTELRLRLATRDAPLERHAVGIFVDGVHAATRLSGPDGLLTFPIEAPPGAEEVRVVARFDADAPWLASTESSTRVLRPPRAAPLATWVAGGSAILALAVAVWLRRRPAQGERARAAVPRPGVVATRPSALIASVRVVSGIVEHAATGEPLRATVRCGSLVAETTNDGRFELQPSDGTHALVIDAPGYEQLEQRIVSPHRGEWQRVTVRLESRRDLASRALLEIVAIVAPHEVGTTATDRELVGIVRARAPRSAELDELAALVEQIVYDAAPPDRSTLERARALATRARATLTRVDSASAGSL